MDAGTTRTPARETLPPEVAKAIEELLWFYWQEQLEAFIADEPGPDDDHCFRWLVTIDRWIEGHEMTAEDIVTKYEADTEAVRARVRSFRG